MTPPTTPIAQRNHTARIDYHAKRLSALTPEQSSSAFHHFLGALEGMCEPKSFINPGLSRERVVRALERAINSQTGT